MISRDILRSLANSETLRWSMKQVNHKLLLPVLLANMYITMCTRQSNQ